MLVASKPADVAPPAPPPAPPMPPPVHPTPVPSPAPVVPPPSAAAPPRRRAGPAVQSQDEMMEERPVRVGKIQWPPQRVDDDRPLTTVGRANDAADNSTVSQNYQETVVAGLQSQPPSSSTRPVCIDCTNANNTATRSAEVLVNASSVDSCKARSTGCTKTEF